jgi:arylsulfatase A-like enzyme
LEQGGSAGLLREGKGSTWEGGMREPAIAWWPGRIKPGGVTSEIGSTLDLFTTSLSLAGAPLPDDRSIDGLDLSPVLFGTGSSPRETMFFYRGTRLYAVRHGPFKAHWITQSAYGPDAPQEHNPPLLFHLGHDPSEQFNVAGKHPEVLQSMAEIVKRHQAELKRGPTQLESRLGPNP